MNQDEAFAREVAENIGGLAKDTQLRKLSDVFLASIASHKYTYNFRWLGRPVIQLPQDMVAMQELMS